MDDLPNFIRRFFDWINGTLVFVPVHRTIQNEFYATAFRRKMYHSLAELQADVDEWIEQYNAERTHTGKHCFGKTPMQTFLDSKHIAIEKQLDLSCQTAVPERTIWYRLSD